MAHGPDEKRAKARLRRRREFRGVYPAHHPRVPERGNMSWLHLRGSILDRITARSSSLIEFRAVIGHFSLEDPCIACEASLLRLTTSMFCDLIASLNAYADRLPISERRQVKQMITWQQLRRDLHDARIVTERGYKRG